VTAMTVRAVTKGRLGEAPLLVPSFAMGQRAPNRRDVALQIELLVEAEQHKEKGASEPEVAFCDIRAASSGNDRQPRSDEVRAGNAPGQGAGIVGERHGAQNGC